MFDLALHYGQSKFFFTDAFDSSSVSGDTHTYAAYIDKDGIILIAQYTADGNTARYSVSKGDYNTIVAARGTYVYYLPNQLSDLNI